MGKKTLCGHSILKNTYLLGINFFFTSQKSMLSFNSLFWTLFKRFAAGFGCKVSDQNPWLEASFRGIKPTQCLDLSPSGRAFENKTVEYNYTNLLRIFSTEILIKLIFHSQLLLVPRQYDERRREDFLTERNP